MKVGRLEILNWILAVCLTGLAACGGDPHQRGAQTEPVPTATQEFADDSKVTAVMPTVQNTPLENNSARSDTFEAVVSARTITVEKAGPTPPLVDRLFDEIEQDEKRTPPLVGSASPVSVSFPTEITTTDGNTYGAVKLSRVEPDGIIISYTVEGGGIGLSKIKYQRLPESLRTRLGFDPSNSGNATHWFTKAAEQGDAQAQCSLGLGYYTGSGARQDYSEAAKWFRKAAEQGHAQAEGFLGMLYANGHGVAEDCAEAVNWYRKGAERGDAGAQVALGASYAIGRGIPQNDIEAYKWYSLAFAQVAEDPSARLLKDAWNSISQRMSRAEIVQGQRRAAEFVAKKEREGGGPGAIAPTPEIAKGKGSAGTGFFITDDGYFVTCEHVVRGATSFHVRSPTGSLPARLIKKDRTIDIALLKVEGAFQALPVAAQPRVKLGEAVFTVGFPNPTVQGVEPKLTRGEISSMAGILDNPGYFQISVPIQPGNSGGALLDQSGNAVGMVTSRLDDAATYQSSGALPQNVNYAVKGGLVYKFLMGVPQLAGKLKMPRTAGDRGSASGAAERAAVLVIAE